MKEVGAALVGILVALLVAARPAVFPERPPPAHTGGFGEPTCHACHFDQALNGPTGDVVIGGLPEWYVPGARYELQVTVRAPSLALAGFQAAARFRDGTQAGILEPVDDRAEVTHADGVAYAHQTVAGVRATGGGAAVWTLRWRAPDTAGDVVVHVTGNAANADASPFGDAIHTDSAVTRSAREK